MKFRPCSAGIADSEPAIKRAVERALAGCDILVPPTPIDRLLQYRKLSTAEQLELEPHKLLYRFRKAASRFWHKLNGKIAGILDLHSRHIAINPALHARRRHFLKFHEVGHDVLPWHRELFVVTAESDLSPAVRRRFEIEANCFAGHAIFQIDHMAAGYRGKRLPIANLAGVAAQYNSSLIAAARHYVAIQDIPTALIVGHPAGAPGARGIRFAYAIANNAFLLQFGSNVLGDGFEPDHPASAVLNCANFEVSQAEIEVVDVRSDRHVILAETLFTTYCTLTLIHVKRRKRLTLAWRMRTASAAAF